MTCIPWQAPLIGHPLKFCLTKDKVRFLQLHMCKQLDVDFPVQVSATCRKGSVKQGVYEWEFIISFHNAKMVLKVPEANKQLV